MPRVTPEDFYSQNPPERIIGSECEYTIQPGSDIAGKLTPIELYCDIGAVAAAGYKFAATPERSSEIPQIFLSNGGKLYPDLGQFFEYCTPESLGPLQAAATDMAGITVVQNIVEASGFEHHGVVRRTGYAHSIFNSTAGYHENYLAPREVTYREALYQLLPTFLSTRMWAWNGAVGPTYELSQKYRGVGDTITTSITEHNRTSEKQKPMVLIRSTNNYDGDVQDSEDWARIEVRFADANMSPVVTYVGFAATSLVLRLCEHPEYISDELRDAVLSDPVAAAETVALDTSLLRDLDTTGGEQYITALDIQHRFLKNIKQLAKAIKLPDSEQRAIPIWERWIGNLGAVQRHEKSWQDLSSELDVAAKFYYLNAAKNIGAAAICNDNSHAVRTDLLWEYIQPDGYGMRHWRKELRKSKAQIVPAPYIRYFVDNAPRHTRAHHRARAISSPQLEIVDITWGSAKAYHAQKSGKTIHKFWHDSYVA